MLRTLSLFSLACLGVVHALGCTVSTTVVEAPEPVGCTEEARVCGDGTTRVRKGPSCEFDPCPEDASTGAEPSPGAPSTEAPSGYPGGVVCTKEAKLCPDGSYVGRTGPSCEFARCPGE
jgi:hypothetical protein